MYAELCVSCSETYTHREPFAMKKGDLHIEGESLHGWSEAAEPARGMRISCVRAGAGCAGLSSARNAGKVPKRAPESSINHYVYI